MGLIYFKIYLLCRSAFSGFDAETVANFTDKQMTSIGIGYGIDISRVRGVVDNSNRILEVIKLHTNLILAKIKRERYSGCLRFLFLMLIN